MAKYLEPRPRDLTDAEYMATRSDEEIYLAIRDGGTAVGLTDRMAAWGDLFSDQEIRDLAALVRSFSQPQE
jgi:cytochrome c oxidase cbb3-type subunit 3